MEIGLNGGDLLASGRCAALQYGGLRSELRGPPLRAWEGTLSTRNPYQE